jgi:hypothetical protein
VAKRLSGGRRCTLRKWGKPPGKPGRPKGQSARTQGLLANIYRDLAWLGDPHRHHSKLSRDLLWLTPQDEQLDLMKVLLQEPKYLHVYNCIGERALRRHVAAVQKKIWPFARAK